MTASSPSAFLPLSRFIQSAQLSICNFSIRTFTVATTTAQSHSCKYVIAIKAT